MSDFTNYYKMKELRKIETEMKNRTQSNAHTYYMNREYILRRKKKKVKCECGCVVAHYYLKVHQRSLKHQRLMEMAIT